jgi:hypothetical protein
VRRLEQLGRQGVIELSLIVGTYSLPALLLNSFDPDLPPDRTEPLRPVKDVRPSLTRLSPSISPGAGGAREHPLEVHAFGDGGARHRGIEGDAEHARRR